MSEEKNIYQRVNAIMNGCDYLQKKQAQQGKGIRYDEVMAMIRPLLIKNGVVMVTSQCELQELGNVDGTKQKVYQGKYTLELVNMDKPEEKIIHTCFAHGMDGGDKGAGKAHTYAMKTMLVKGFGIETGEDEESRAEKIEKQTVINSGQYNQLKEYCITAGENGAEWTQIGLALLKAYNIPDLVNLPAAMFEDALKRVKSYANNK